MISLGIDPGKKGGYAIVSRDGILEQGKLPNVIHDFRDLLGAWSQSRLHMKVFIERCQARPGQAVSSMFKYGVHYGELLGLMAALDLPVETIPPQRWQKKMLGKFNKGESKKAALAKARQLFPRESFILDGCRVAHDGIVDAVLIAEYGRGLHV